LIQQGV